jgi:hypothetical protein
MDGKEDRRSFARMMGTRYEERCILGTNVHYMSKTILRIYQSFWSCQCRKLSKVSRAGKVQSWKRKRDAECGPLRAQTTTIARTS